VQQYLLKRISVEEYSLLPIIYSLMIFVPLFSVILVSGIKRYVLVAYVENQGHRITQIVSSMFPVLCSVSLFLLLIGGIAAWQIDTLLRIEPEYVDDARIMLMLIIFLEALRLPMEAFCSGLYVQQRFVLENLIKITGECIRLTLLLVLLLGWSVSVVSVVVATVAGGLVEATTLCLVSRHLLPEQRFNRMQFDWFVVKELANFGGWSSLCGIGGMIRRSAAPIILNRWATPLDITCFHLGSLIPNRLEVIVNQSFLGTVSPVVVGLHADNQQDRLKSMYLRLGRLSMWGVLIAIAPLFVHYEQIVILYVGETYLSAGTVMFLLLACYPIVYGNLLHGPLATAKALVRLQAIRESISAVLSLFLTLLLVGYYQLGAVGAAISTFLVYGLGSLVLFWPFGKGMVGATWSDVWNNIFMPGIIPFCATLATMKLLTWNYPATSWSAIAVNSIAGAFVYLIVVWIVAKEVDKAQFRDALLSLLARLSSR